MALQLDTPTGGNVIHRIEPGAVWVNGQRWAEPVLVPWQGEVRAWPVGGFEALDAGHFERLLTPRPEIILFSSGGKLRFPHPSLWRSVMQAGVGFDTMDLAAACRTFSVLTSENRQVLAALLLD